VEIGEELTGNGAMGEQTNDFVFRNRH
jgi:hypothetical protein